MTGPRVKFDREKILNGAVNFIDEFGLIELSARNLAKYINSSTQPLFRVYKNIDELINDARLEISKIQDEYVNCVSSEFENKFLGIGVGYLRFAKDHPNFFYVLFLDSFFKKEKINDFFSDEGSVLICKTLSDNLKISLDDATKLFRNVWLVAHGTASLIYAKQVKYNDEEIIDILKTTFAGTLMEIRGKNNV